jgi:hypothetical protein
MGFMIFMLLVYPKITHFYGLCKIYKIKTMKVWGRRGQTTSPRQPGELGETQTIFV